MKLAECPADAKGPKLRTKNTVLYERKMSKTIESGSKGVLWTLWRSFDRQWLIVGIMRATSTPRRKHRMRGDEREQDNHKS